MKAIVDCNSFYCSCERVFRPDLENKPVIVLSNNDGCIISLSNEAKAAGIDMAIPYFQAKETIDEFSIETFSSNYNLYGDMSRRVMQTMEALVGEENIEVYSVDEAFLDLSAVPVEELYNFSLMIRNTVEKWTGISVSVGVGKTKVLAKVANKLCKKKQLPDKVMVLDSEESTAHALQQTLVKNIWGIGGQYAKKLQNEWNIHTAWELKHMSVQWAKTHLGGVVGVRMIEELNGKPAIKMEQPLVNKKMIATTRMFGNAVTDLEDIKEAIATYTTRAAEKLRRQHSAASIISVFVVPQQKTDDPYFKHGYPKSTYTTLASPTSLTHELIKPAMQMAERLYEKGQRYKKAGVTLSGLVPDTSIQSNLFEPEKANDRGLMAMLDNVNFSMRDDVIKYAAAGINKHWKMRQEFRSPRYTARWNELYEVK